MLLCRIVTIGDYILSEQIHRIIVHIGFKLPNSCVTNRDRRQTTKLKYWALSEKTVTDRDKLL